MLKMVKRMVYFNKMMSKYVATATKTKFLIIAVVSKYILAKSDYQSSGMNITKKLSENLKRAFPEAHMRRYYCNMFVGLIF